MQPVELEHLPDRRHAADAREHVAADGLEAFGLDRDVQPVADFVDAGLRAEYPRAVAFIDNRLGLDVVLVPNLADDLLEQILERDEAGRAAVFVDDDRHLDLPALEFLQQLRHALGFGHEHRRTHEPRNGLAAGVRLGQHDQVLDEHDALDVVEVLLEDGNARVFLLAEERAQLPNRRFGRDGDDVRTRRHDLADQRAAEIDDGLQQGALLLLDEVLLLDRLRTVRRFPRAFFRAVARRCILPLPPAVDDQPHEGAGQRVEEPGGEVERRQQELERLLGIAPHDEERQHVLEDKDEDRHEEQQHPDRRKALGAGEHREDDRREREDEAEHQPGRHEELDGIVEVEPESIVAAAALDHQAKRQAHQGAERRFNRAHVDRGEREEQQERDHAPARRVRGAPTPARSARWRGRPCGAAAPRRGPSVRCPGNRDGRSRANAAGHAGPARAARPDTNDRLPGPGGARHQSQSRCHRAAHAAPSGRESPANERDNDVRRHVSFRAVSGDSGRASWHRSPARRSPRRPRAAARRRRASATGRRRERRGPSHC